MTFATFFSYISPNSSFNNFLSYASKKGKNIRAIKKILNTQSNNALISPLVDKKAPIGAGNVQGTKIAGLETQFIYIAIYVVIVIVIGPNINGITKYGFNIIGAPKITGSLILNILGINAVFPIAFRCEDFALNNIRKTKPIVHPDPPIQMNQW